MFEKNVFEKKRSKINNLSSKKIFCQKNERTEEQYYRLKLEILLKKLLKQIHIKI